MHIIKAVFAFKSINGETAPYLRETLKLNREQHCRNTRYAEVNFICPKYKRETEGGRTFSVTTIKLWNSLPLNLRRYWNVRTYFHSLVSKTKFLVSWPLGISVYCKFQTLQSARLPSATHRRLLNYSLAHLSVPNNPC
jgi:hypothetical protein